ncbi:hypothetical protein lerEdw1_017992 [Lerista edwardsae]|nr:hypothetical protein lerEdw1_017992 [Lerista edwardsae]
MQSGFRNMKPQISSLVLLLSMNIVRGGEGFYPDRYQKQANVKGPPFLPFSVKSHGYKLSWCSLMVKSVSCKDSGSEIHVSHELMRGLEFYRQEENKDPSAQQDPLAQEDYLALQGLQENRDMEAKGHQGHQVSQGHQDCPPLESQVILVCQENQGTEV